MRLSQLTGILEKAWHGSPAFVKPKFSLDKIGTGEGATAYGWGMYFASRQAVGAWYAEELSKNVFVYSDSMTPRQIMGLEEINLEVDQNKKLATLSPFEVYNMMVHRATVNAEDEWDRDAAYAAKNSLEKLKSLDPRKISRATKYLYNVSIPEEDDYLDWDNSMKNQPADILAKIKGSFKTIVGSMAVYRSEDFWDMTGKDFYNSIAMDAKGDINRAGQKKASMLLHSVGIIGLKYLDGASRHVTGDRSTRNYVIWDEDVIDINQVNGKVYTGTDK
jgi:hypothetical protein